MDAKKIFRETTLYLLSTGVVIVLLLLSYFIVFTQIGANPEKIKEILSSSGVYQKVPATIYDEAVKSAEASSPAAADIPLQDPAVRQAALNAFSGDFIQKSAESVVDGTYGWLGGETSQPEFNIDLNGAKNQFAAALADEFGARLENLPVCTVAQLRANPDINLFTATCRPPGANVAELKAEILNTVANSEEFVEQTQLTPATLKDEQGKPIFDNLANAPEAYKLSKKIPYILGLIAFLLASAIIYASKSREAGLSKLGKLFVLSGIFVVLAPIGFGFITDAFMNASSNNNVASNLINPVIDEMSRAAASIYYKTGAVYLVVGAGLLILVNRMKKQVQEQSS